MILCQKKDHDNITPLKTYVFGMTRMLSGEDRSDPA